MHIEGRAFRILGSWLLAGWIILGTGLSVCRGETVDSTRVYGLEEVRVAGRRPAVSLYSPVPAQTLSGERLERINSLSVADAVRRFSGVQLKDYGGVGGLKTVNVRSLGSAHTGVYLDGMAIGNAQNGQVDLGRFSLENLEMVQLNTGQVPDIFLPARSFFSSSVLSLKSRAPQPGLDRQGSLRLKIKGGGWGLFHPSLLWQGDLSEKTSVSLHADYLQSDGKYPFRYSNGVYDTTAHRTNGDIRSYRAEANLFSRLGNRGAVHGKIYWYQSERGLPGAVVANRFAGNQRQDDQNLFLFASFRQSWNDRCRSMVNVKYSYDYTRYLDPDYLNDRMCLENRYHLHELALSWVHHRRFTPWCDVALALDGARQTLEAKMTDSRSPERWNLWASLSVNGCWERLHVQLQALFMQVWDYPEPDGDAQKRNEWCPVFSLSWQPFGTEELRLRLLGKRSFRMPTFNDLYYVDLFPRNLSPEKTGQLGAGVVWNRRREGFWREVAVQADGYLNRVTDKIVAVPAANLFSWSVMNLGKVEITGVTVNTHAEIMPLGGLFCLLEAHYTWERAQDKTGRTGATASFYGKQIPYAPRHSGSLSLETEYGGWFLRYHFLYSGERYCQRDNAPESYLEPWYTSDLGAGYIRRFGRHTLRMQAEVNNLFDLPYEVVRTYPMPGRGFQVNLSLTL